MTREIFDFFEANKKAGAVKELLDRIPSLDRESAEWILETRFGGRCQERNE